MLKCNKTTENLAEGHVNGQGHSKCCFLQGTKFEVIGHQKRRLIVLRHKKADSSTECNNSRLVSD